MAQTGSQSFWQNIADLYDENMVQKTNPIVLQWPMVNNDRLNLWIIFCYLLFIKRIGPSYMKDRKPFDLRWLMVPYNVALVVFNFYLFWEFLKIRLYGGFESGCATLDSTDNPYTYRLAEVSWWFYMTKFIELSDTVFFVLRKKERQLSRLHIVHHSSVPLLCFAMMRSEPGGYNSFFPLANSFVHCVMYTYYGIAALGEEMKVHLWFKKYVTMTQMIQFILVLSYFLSRPFMGCKTSKLSFGFNVFIAGFFFILFCNFYWNEYLKNEQEKRNEARLANGAKKKE